MNVLIACEYSGVVRDAFLKLGHNAWSCDTLPSDTEPLGIGHHFQGDVRWWLDNKDWPWDLMVAHPPCTYLTGAAEWAFADVPTINGKPRNIKPGTLIGAERRQAREDALSFVRELFAAPIERIALENPVGVIGSRIKPASQWIHPHQFGHDASKATGLWLKNLPPLTPTQNIEPRYVSGKPRWGNQTDSGQNRLPPSSDRWKLRSTTFKGIADAMANQWGNL